MAFVNNVQIIRRDLLTRIAEMVREDNLLQEIDRLPIEIARRIRNNERCCYHKTKAVVKYKVMGLLGFGLEDETDELDNLTHYATLALKNGAKNDKFLVVVHEACTSCVKSNYIITNLCKGCIAQPCINNCPKKAISRTVTGQAKIDPGICVNCGICQSLCPYHSIIYMPVPCEESCPAGAIKKDESGAEQIDKEKCILCGKCVNACPFGSIIEITELLQVMQLLSEEKNCTAIIAPAIFGQFNAKKGSIINALKKLGFKHVVEVAEGARETTIHESSELIDKKSSGQNFITSSCCSAWVNAARKHVPEILPFVSETPSPMAFTAKKCKEEFPGSPVVFIGPCVAKRKEGRENANIDNVMTFEELSCLLNGWKIPVAECDDDADIMDIDNYSRNYCISGGVSSAVINECKNSNLVVKTINGLDRKQLKLLSVYAKSKNADNADFVEVMSCEGGCIAGPCSSEFPKDARKYFRLNVQENPGPIG
ncbi:MAG TPA: monomeric [FeFe] hydrogenase [Bacteroidales bacterium]|nr:monomeric [FeFe] hydrogenase [Bacteroidales bacterium]